MLCIAGGSKVLTSLHPIFKNSTTQTIREQFSHPDWVGFTFYDIIMPLFMFIVGISLSFSFKKRLEQQGKNKFLTHVSIRTAILFVLGMIYGGELLSLDISKIQPLSNTLSAIAIGYLGASILMLTQAKTQWLLTTIFLASYWFLLKHVPVPNHGPGAFSPAGNMAAYIEHLILGQHKSKGHYTYLLPSLVFIVTVMMGVFAGNILKSEKSPPQKVTCLMGCGVLCCLLGYLWGFETPIIKRIWTSSFTIFSGGFCFLLMGLFYLIIDVWGWKKWSYPLVVIGANAILVYMIFAYNRFINLYQIAGKIVFGLDQWIGPWKHFSRSVVAVVLLYAIMNHLYKKKTFFKV